MYSVFTQQYRTNALCLKLVLAPFSLAWWLAKKCAKCLAKRASLCQNKTAPKSV